MPSPGPSLALRPRGQHTSAEPPSARWVNTGSVLPSTPRYPWGATRGPNPQHGAEAVGAASSLGRGRILHPLLEEPPR